MSLFGSYRDDRRRRSLAEDSAGEDFAGQATVTSKPSAKPQRYHSAARRENHRPTTDFVPRSWWKLSLFYFAGLLLIGGLLAGAAWVANADSIKVTGVVELLAVSQSGSLVRWFSSLMFLLAAGGSILIYSVRRHKVDDYRGRYRLWLWCALAWMVMSIDATANLHQPFSYAMTALTGWSLSGAPVSWWIGVWGTILAILIVRLVFETRECRSAMFAVLAVATLWIAALAIELGWLPSGGQSILVAAGCRAVGQLTLLLSIGLYARHVLLDAEGLITIREAKPKREKPPKKAKVVAAAPTTDLDSGKTTRIDAAHKPGDKQGGLASHVKAVTSSNRNTASVSSSEPAGASYSSNRSSRLDDDSDDDNDRNRSRNSSQRRYDDDEGDDEDDGQRKLSKAERKRLRKQMRRQERDDD
jgi:hypothetical protein